MEETYELNLEGERIVLAAEDEHDALAQAFRQVAESLVISRFEGTKLPPTPQEVHARLCVVRPGGVTEKTVTFTWGLS